jgi:hypothetical protein
MHDFSSIEAERKRSGLSVRQLCLRAKIHQTTYWRVKTGREPRFKAHTIGKLRKALSGKPVPQVSGLAPETLLTAYRAYCALAAPEFGADPRKVLDADPSLRANASPEWALAARVRAVAVYCVVVEFGVAAARVAAAIGLTRQAVSQMVRRVEELRGDEDQDFIERIGRLVSGRE